MTDLRERAERTDREQRLLAERARAGERARLAREMHDVVTHRVTLMVLQAGALEVTGVDPDSRRAAQAVRESGMQALDELRGLVRVLRSPDPDPEEPLGASPTVGPPDALPDLQELVAASTAAGASVRLDRRGEPAATSPVVARTAHRIVQEALTNAHKHAPGGEVAVAVDYAPEAVTVRVRNATATAEPDGLAASGSGSGLRGLRERRDDRWDAARGTLRGRRVRGPRPAAPRRDMIADVPLPAEAT
jgi:signal transduction histidine kinase